MSSAVSSTASSTKVWQNSVHWFARYRAKTARTGRTHERTHAPMEARAHGRTTEKHNASDSSIGGRRRKNITEFDIIVTNNPNMDHFK